MIPNIDILEEELDEVEYASNTYRIVNVDVYDKIEAPTLIASGKCGDNAIWEYYSDGGFVVSGRGSTMDCELHGDYEWSNFKNEAKFIVVKNGITRIGDAFFAHFFQASQILISDSVTTIGDYAFNWCISLTSVIIGKGVTTICDYAFEGCTSLKNIIIPNNVKTIGDYAFYNCNILENIVIGDGVTTISDYSFSGCYFLESVTIGSSVTTIGQNAFENSSNLKTVFYVGSQSDWELIEINDSNQYLLNATLVCDYVVNHKSKTNNNIISQNYPHPYSTCSDYYDRINGYVDDMDAIKQAIYLILSTERYKHIIYSWDYGVELIDLYGKPLPYVMAELPRRIKEALTQDNRIEDVIDFEFKRNGKRLYTTFTVVTNAGNLTTDLEVEV